MCFYTERSEHKKLMSEANSELLLLFIEFEMVLTKKLPQRTERKRSSIEFERSENQGQFFILSFLIKFNIFKSFMVT
jgi:hypothetical protein